MMYATYTTIPKDMMKDANLTQDYLKAALAPKKQKGVKFIRHRLRASDQHEDNFITNRVTFVMEYMMYKKPRFIK